MLICDQLLIDDKPVDARGGARFPTVKPTTEDVLGAAVDAGPEDLDAAISGARAAFDAGDWAGEPLFRAPCLRQRRPAR